MIDMRTVINDASEIIMKAHEQQTNTLLYNLRPEVVEQKKRLEKQRANCQYMELEQDMGFKVPYCIKTSQYCNGQCL